MVIWATSLKVFNMIIIHEHFFYGFTAGLFVGAIYMIANDEKWRRAYNSLLLKYREKNNDTSSKTEKF